MFTTIVSTLMAVNGGIFALDEAAHLRRGLPLWERISHPIDTGLVLALALMAGLAPTTPGWLAAMAFIGGLAFMSVTKDEAVHAEHCGPGEHWLHAVLFMLHPFTLGAMFACWLARRGDLGTMMTPEQGAHLAQLQSIALMMVLCHQIVYWLVLRERFPSLDFTRKVQHGVIVTD